MDRVNRFIARYSSPTFFCSYCLKEVCSYSKRNTDMTTYFWHDFCPFCDNILINTDLLGKPGELK
jgi:hypothetical protein